VRRPGWRLAVVVILPLMAAGAHAEPRQPAAARAARTHVVVQGDTLGGIAARYKVTVAALVAANRLASERVVLRLGQRLTIPAAAPAASVTEAARRPGRMVAPQRTATSPRMASLTPVPAVRPPAPARGPRGLELAVPEFVELSPLFNWPVEGPVSSTFGRRRGGWHRGIDIKADQGTVILAAAAGTVVVSGVEPRYGRVVKLEHDHRTHGTRDRPPPAFRDPPRRGGLQSALPAAAAASGGAGGAERRGRGRA
jgi:murein DD-endopeptidase MepM/ murein hydrolase activator NlpD